ncbi:MAG: hypothetical protein HY800_08605, partial [Ignavibacteriales bacterium]|nr:hypothetical protein [Ignavibacteriales bacterium]
KFTKTFQQRKNDDINALLLRWQTKANPWERAVESDWFYEVSTGRSSKLERLFQRVPKGNGNYIYLGDLNNNHIIDQQDFQLSRFDGEYIAVTLPTDELIPVIDVKASTRVRLNPGRLISQNGWFGKGLSTLSSETYLRVEEKSRETDKKKIYFLQFGYFLKDATTIIGSNLIIQDLYFLENNPSFNLRYRYTQRLGLTEYAQSIERTYMHENSLRVRWELVKEISNQSEYIQKVDILTASQDNQRSREISSQAISSDWSYRPMQEFELGFKFQFGNAANFDTSRADINDQSIRFVYALIEQGQVRVEFIREEVLMQRIGNIVPFELTNGRLSGKSWIWNVNFDYRIFTYIQMSLNYEGRSEGGREAVHIGKAEVRAFF